MGVYWPNTKLNSDYFCTLRDPLCKRPYQGAILRKRGNLCCCIDIPGGKELELDPKKYATFLIAHT